MNLLIPIKHESSNPHFLGRKRQVNSICENNQCNT